MKICTKCRIEMRCICTGKRAVWHGHHCYQGDEYQCPVCEATFMNCNPQPYHSEMKLDEDKHEKVIDMTKESVHSEL